MISVTCQRVCMSVCLLLCLSVHSKTTRPNFTKVSVHFACGHGSVLLRLQCDRILPVCVFFADVNNVVCSRSPGGGTGCEICRLRPNLDEYEFFVGLPVCNNHSELFKWVRVRGSAENSQLNPKQRAEPPLSPPHFNHWFDTEKLASREARHFSKQIATDVKRTVCAKVVYDISPVDDGASIEDVSHRRRPQANRSRASYTPRQNSETTTGPQLSACVNVRRRVRLSTAVKERSVPSGTRWCRVVAVVGPPGFR